MDQVSLSTYLLRRISELGAKHIFGIPGDYVLPLFDEILDGSHDVKHVMPCNELNGGYAADGYSKINGFGAMAVTFGVGSLSTTNAVAGAYADDTPMIVVCGCPTVDVLSTPTERLYHHNVGTDFDTNLRIFSNITCASMRVTQIDTACYEIDQALRKSIQSKKPVYLEIPYDLQTAMVDLPARPIDLMLESSSAENLAAAIAVSVDLVRESKTRSVVAGHLLQRERQIENGLKLVDALGASVSTTFTCKMGDFEAHKSCIGIYMGEVCEEYTKGTVHGADLVVCAGVTFNEFDTGVFSTKIGDDQNAIWIRQNYVEINGKRFDAVYLRDFLPAFVNALKDEPAAQFTPSDLRRFAFERRDKFSPTDEAITIDRLFVQFSNYFQVNDTLYCDTGGFINSSQAEFPAGVVMHGCGNWGSLGAGFGMFLGGCIAHSGEGTRLITIQGEGAFTMTAQELSTLIAHKKDVALFILDNGGYGAERAIHPGVERSYNDISPWNYENLATAMGGEEGVSCFSHVVKTEVEMQNALESLESFSGANVIRVMLHPWDSASFNLRFSELLRH